MSWHDCYQPTNKELWQGRTDIPPNSCLFQMIKSHDLREPIPQTKDNCPSFALLGFSCDVGVRRNQGRPGAAEGPALLRRSLAKLPIQRDIKLYDAGDITCIDDDLEKAQQALAEAVALLLKQHITPIVIGGGHELAWGHYQGIASHIAEKQLGIINFDAHFDMRPLLPNQRGSSGTPFLQIAQAHENAKKKFDYNCIGIQPAGNIPLLFQTAEKYHVDMIFAEQIHQGDLKTCNQLINRIIKENDVIYLTLCLDVFAAPYAPGVSAPQALGLTPWQIIPYVRQLASCGKVISYDLAELSPPYDKDERTAKLAASFIYEILHHHATGNKR